MSKGFMMMNRTRDNLLIRRSYDYSKNETVVGSVRIRKPRNVDNILFGPGIGTGPNSPIRVSQNVFGEQNLFVVYNHL